MFYRIDPCVMQVLPCTVHNLCELTLHRCSSRVDSQKQHRFNHAFSAPSVRMVRANGVIFILLNSMAFEGDNCDMCVEARRQLKKLTQSLNCSKVCSDFYSQTSMGLILRSTYICMRATCLLRWWKCCWLANNLSLTPKYFFNYVGMLGANQSELGFIYSEFFMGRLLNDVSVVYMYRFPP